MFDVQGILLDLCFVWSVVFILSNFVTKMKERKIHLFLYDIYFDSVFTSSEILCLVNFIFDSAYVIIDIAAV